MPRKVSIHVEEVCAEELSKAGISRGRWSYSGKTLSYLIGRGARTRTEGETISPDWGHERIKGRLQAVIHRIKSEDKQPPT